MQNPSCIIEACCIVQGYAIFVLSLLYVIQEKFCILLYKTSIYRGVKCIQHNFTLRRTTVCLRDCIYMYIPCILFMYVYTVNRERSAGLNFLAFNPTEVFAEILLRKNFRGALDSHKNYESLAQRIFPRLRYIHTLLVYIHTYTACIYACIYCLYIYIHMLLVYIHTYTACIYTYICCLYIYIHTVQLQIFVVENFRKKV